MKQSRFQFPLPALFVLVALLGPGIGYAVYMQRHLDRVREVSRWSQEVQATISLCTRFDKRFDRVKPLQELLTKIDATPELQPREKDKLRQKLETTIERLK